MQNSFYSREGDNLLRAAKIRKTRPRQVIAHVLTEACDHPDAEQILIRGRTYDASLSQATAYRTLAVLVEKGLLRTHTFGGSATRYELADQANHDHLIDVETGEVQDFVSLEIEQLQARVAKARGYEIVAHRHELYCRKASRP